MGSAQYDSRGISAADTWAYFRQLLGQAGVGTLLGMGPKELWSLASWLVYVGYFHFRYMFGKKHARINSVWAIAGMVVIAITLLWVNLSRLFSGLHSYAI